MTTNKIILFIFFLAISYIGIAQTQFISSGKITFEKKVNIHKEIEGDSWLENLKDKIPKYRSTFHHLYFAEGKTLFEKGEESDVKIPFFDDDLSSDDIIYTDIKQGIFAKKQAVFDETFLITDSIRKVKWQMTNELRDIAGFECHKAVGIILDSVYVIAYYTDQITVEGGPLSYCKLPGMILGIAIPRANMSIFATKIELTIPKEGKISIPKGKMKNTNYKELNTTLQAALKRWGSYGRKYIINSLL